MSTIYILMRVYGFHIAISILIVVVLTKKKKATLASVARSSQEAN